MPSLYNCKHSGDQYKITKFDSDFNVEASYLCDLVACECPAGHRPTCRHRQMLPKFIAREAVGTLWFLDFDRGGWVQGWKEEPSTIKTFNELSYAQDKEQSAFYSIPIQQPLLDQPEQIPSTLNMIALAHDEAIVQQEIEEGLKHIDTLSPSPTIRRRV